MWNGDLIFGLGNKSTLFMCWWYLFSDLAIFIPKKDDNCDGVGRQPEYGDGGEKDALEDKFEVVSSDVVDLKILT